jgi:hypothetical protein
MGEMMARMEVDQERIKEAMITSKEYLKYEVVGQEWTYPIFGVGVSEGGLNRARE